MDFTSLLSGPNTMPHGVFGNASSLSPIMQLIGGGASVPQSQQVQMMQRLLQIGGGQPRMPSMPTPMMGMGVPGMGASMGVPGMSMPSMGMASGMAPTGLARLLGY